MQTETVDGMVLENWSVEDVAEAMAGKEIVLIDVRTPQEYLFEYIHGALLLPMAGFDAGYLPEPGHKQIVLHCGSGVRSRMVAQKMHAAGHDKVAHLEGGFGAWKTAGKPYMGIDPATGAQRAVNG